MKIPFKYKLSISISLIIIGVLVGVFLVLHADIEEDALLRIETQLNKTKEIVADLIEARRTRLAELAVGVGGSEGLHDLIAEPDLAPEARAKIVRKEILPNFPRLSLFCVIGPDKELLGANDAARKLQGVLIGADASRDAFNGLPGHGFVLQNQKCIQLSAIPILLKSHPAGQARGIVMVGMTWTQEDLDRILDLTGVQIALFREGVAILSTGAPFRREDVPFDLEKSRRRSIWKISSQTPKLAQVNNDRFIVLKVKDGQGVSPAFAIAKSLDGELTFFNQITFNMIIFGLAGIGLGLGVSLFFGMRVSRPLRALVKASEKVEAGQYGWRVQVKGRDEFSQLSQSFNQMLAGLQERDYIRNTFGRYIDPEVARELLQHPEAAALGGQKRDVPILMSDIRGFTAICEELTPAEALKWLNAYFSQMIIIVKKHNGIIIDFVGDAILVFFEPLGGTLASAAGRAVNCAFDMQRQTSIFNSQNEASRFPEVQIGAGLNAGPVIVGNIGSEDRIKYGIVGSAVNLTQRIQAHAGPGETIVSRALLEQVHGIVRITRQFEATLKGIREPFVLYGVAPIDEASGEENKSTAGSD